MNKYCLPLLLLMAACSPAAEESVANRADSPVAEEAEVAPVPPLAGEWSITAVDGAPLNQVFDMAASVTDDRLTIDSECVTMAWEYTQNRNAVTFTPVPAVTCARMQTQNEDQVEQAVGGANMALFLEDGDEVHLSGSGGMVTMTRR